MFRGFHQLLHACRHDLPALDVRLQLHDAAVLDCSLLHAGRGYDVQQSVEKGSVLTAVSDPVAPESLWDLEPRSSLRHVLDQVMLTFGLVSRSHLTWCNAMQKAAACMPQLHG